MWYHISNGQNSNNMDLCVLPLNIYVLLFYFWTWMFHFVQKPWWWHIQRYNYIRICRFDLQTKKSCGKLKNHQHDDIYYRKSWALDLPQLHLNKFYQCWKKRFNWRIVRENISGHINKTQIINYNTTWWSAFGIVDGLEKSNLVIC